MQLGDTQAKCGVPHLLDAFSAFRRWEGVRPALGGMQYLCRQSPMGSIIPGAVGLGQGRLILTQPRISIPQPKIADFCRRNHVRWLALFGSVLRDDFRPDSDIDVLVEFEAEAQFGLMALGRIQRELSALLERPVDLVLRDGLKPVIRDSVIASAQEVYAA